MEQKQAKRFTISILVLMFGYAFISSTPSLFANGFISDFHITDLELGIVGSIVNVGGLVALVTVPLLQGRVKKWTMLLIGALVQAAMLLFAGVVPAFWLLLVSYLVMGIGMGWLDSYGNSGIVDINKENSTKYMSMMHGSYGIGAFTAPIIIQALLTVVIWRYVNFMLAGLIALTVVFFLIQTKRNGGNTNISGGESRLRFSEIKGYLKERYNLLLIGSGVMYCATMSVSSFWVVRYATETFKDNGATGALALSVCWLFSTISRFGAPLLKKRPLALFAVGVSTMGVFQVLGVLIGNQAVLVAAFGAIGLFSGQCMPMLMNEINIKYPGRTSMATSVNLFMMYIARILMPLVAGFVATVINITVSMLMPIVTGLLGGLFAYMAIRMDKASEAIEKSAAV
jgi:fucose permease